MRVYATPQYRKFIATALKPSFESMTPLGMPVVPPVSVTAARSNSPYFAASALLPLPSFKNSFQLIVEQVSGTAGAGILICLSIRTMGGM